MKDNAKWTALTGALLVAADKIHQARLKLAANGLSGRDTVGFELLDQEQALETALGQ